MTEAIQEMHKVEARRKERGWTRLELAQISGLSVGTILGIEKRTSPYKTQLQVAEILAETLECEVSDLFDKDELSRLGRPPLTGRPLSGIGDGISSDPTGTTTTVTSTIEVVVKGDGGKDVWTVSHVREGQVCPGCRIMMPLSGVCENCN